MQPVIFRKIKLYHIILTVLLNLCAFFYYLWDYCEYGQTGIAKKSKKAEKAVRKALIGKSGKSLLTCKSWGT